MVCIEKLRTPKSLIRTKNKIHHLTSDVGDRISVSNRITEVSAALWDQLFHLFLEWILQIICMFHFILSV